jgi:iron complex outermembrane receptor protein
MGFVPANSFRGAQMRSLRKFLSQGRWLAPSLGALLGGAALTTSGWVGVARAADETAASSPLLETLEEIVVTGTSIRGVAPVGTNLITVGREEIEDSGAQTLQQVLRSVPAITGFGTAAQGGQGSADGAGTFAPTIHGLGASSSNGTLVLIDGHRLPLSGINHTLADPNVIAPLAIERVEVLPEGASATYGSDAVAGVINFITRRNFNGFEATAQGAWGSSYSTHSAGFIWGNTWNQGSVLVTYNYSHRSNLLTGDRDFAAANHTAQSGGNFSSLNCSPATVQVGTNIYAYPYTGAPATSSTATNNGLCDYTGVVDLLPEDTRHNLLIKISHDVNEQLKLTTDIVWGKQNNTANITRGNLSNATTVWGPGSTPPGGAGQVNPFFVGAAGATSESVRWDADELFGPGATNKGGADSLFATFGAEYSLPSSWQATFGTTIGKDDSRLKREGVLCNSCALLALNGTTNTGGNITTPSVPGTTTPVLGLPLTAANALDVWLPAGSNRTSAAVRSQLLDSVQLQIAHQTLTDATLKLDGPLFKLPGGYVRAALGFEYLKYTMSEELTRERGTGPASVNSTTFFTDFGRNVRSGFLEVLIPIVGPDNAIPLVRRLELDLAGRHDRYSDFGGTTNPKFAVSWGLTEGFTVRGNIARSFTAPALSSRGDDNGINAEASVSGFNFGQVAVPNTFPGAIGLPGCTAATPTCTIGTAAVTGFQVNGGNKDLQPEKGKTFSVGFDLTPMAVPGLHVSGTYWSAKYEGAVTAPQPAFAIAAPGLNFLLQLFPGGATQAQINAATAGLPFTAALPTTTYFIYSFRNRNAIFLDAAGIDAEIGYSFKTSVGEFNTDLSVSRKTKMDEYFGTDGAKFSVLNTTGINTTFPSHKMAARATLGWKRNSWNADVFVNYTGSYVSWSNNAAQGNASWAIIRQNGLYPIGGGQPVSAYTTVDLHLGYSFDRAGAWSNIKVFVDGSNVLDKAPPFYNTGVGYDTFTASPIGRLITVGVSKKW